MTKCNKKSGSANKLGEAGSPENISSTKRTECNTGWNKIKAGREICISRRTNNRTWGSEDDITR